MSYREGDILLEDSAMVAAFRPLTVLHPSSAETVLALGTSRQLVFVGGPRPWPGRGAEHGKSMAQGDTKAKKDMLEVGYIEVVVITFDALLEMFCNFFSFIADCRVAEFVHRHSRQICVHSTLQSIRRNQSYPLSL